MWMDRFRIAHLNVRSLTAHMDDFRNLVLDGDYDIIGITETWLSGSVADNLLFIDGYQMERCDRLSRGGGVALYIKNNIKYVKLSSGIQIEQLWIKFELSGDIFSIGIVYKPPTTNYSDFFVNLETTLSDIIPSVNHAFCLGDFNVNLLNINSAETAFVCDFLEGLGLHQIVDVPTRVTDSSVSLIDFILCTSTDNILDKGVVPVDFSDHSLVFCVVNTNIIKPEVQYKTIRNFKYLNYNQFQSDLRSIPWNNIYFMDDIDEKISFISDTITTLLNIHAPFVTYRLTKKYAPWFTDGLRAIKKDRDKALTKFKRTKSQADGDNYRILRNMLTSAVRREKKNYYVTSSNSKNSKQIWSDLRLLDIKPSKGNSIPEDLADVELINNNFINSIPKLKVHSDTVRFYMTNKITDANFKFHTVSENQVFDILTKVRSTATGSDGLNIKSINLCIPFLLPYLTHIINYCLERNVFPSAWKRALVVPIPKVARVESLQQLRPISILPTMSKILESLMHAQLSNYLISNKIIPATQSGFRKGHGCSTALLAVLDDIINNVDKGKLTILALLDFSKAFDTLCHEIMCAIFHYVGLSEDAAILLKNYLTDREQAVRYGSEVSGFLGLRSGVPQGSILGPLLFILYTSSFRSAFLSCLSHYYADDTQVYLSFLPEESSQAISAINFDLSSFTTMSKNHNLILNSDKSIVVIFGKKTDRERFNETHSHSIVINNNPLQIKQSARNLGLIMDNEFRFSEHVSKRLQIAYMNLKLIFQHRRVLNKQLKTALCEAFVLSQLTFCDTVYGPCISSLVAGRIQKLQNSCVRLIFGIRKYDHISHAFVENGWLKMDQRRYLHTVCLYHKILDEKSPPYLYNRIRFRTDVHNVNLRFKGKLTIPAHHKALFERSFSYRIAKDLNDFPDSIICLSQGRFRKFVRTKLLIS